MFTFTACSSREFWICLHNFDVERITRCKGSAIQCFSSLMVVLFKYTASRFTRGNVETNFQVIFRLLQLKISFHRLAWFVRLYSILLKPQERIPSFDYRKFRSICFIVSQHTECQLIKLITGSKTSKQITLNNGLLQGSVLAPVLFSIADMSITKSKNSRYADDWGVVYPDISKENPENTSTEDI